MSICICVIKQDQDVGSAKTENAFTKLCVKNIELIKILRKGCQAKT